MRLILADEVATASELLENESPLEVWELGSELRRWSPADAATAAEAAYERQVRALGERGQRLLGSIRVAVVGLGGTGSVVAQQLAHLGVGSLQFIDPDAIEVSNLNRVVGARADNVGRSKVDVACEMVRGIRPGLSTTSFAGDVRDATVAQLLLDCDLIFCCTDSQGSRAVLNQIAYQYFIPVIDLGVAIHATNNGVSHMSGRVQLLAPGQPCLVCGGVLEPEAVRRELLTDEVRARDPYIVGASETIAQPAVISINSAVASMAVTMLLSVVSGLRMETRHQRLRLESGITTAIVGSAAPGCPICSREGHFGRGTTWPAPGRK